MSLVSPLPTEPPDFPTCLPPGSGQDCSSLKSFHVPKFLVAGHCWICFIHKASGLLLSPYSLPADGGDSGGIMEQTWCSYWEEKGETEVKSKKDMISTRLRHELGGVSSLVCTEHLLCTGCSLYLVFNAVMHP